MEFVHCCLQENKNNWALFDCATINLLKIDVSFGNDS